MAGELMHVRLKPAGKDALRWWARNYRRKAFVPISQIRRTQYHVYREVVHRYFHQKRWKAVRLFSLGNGTWAVDNGHHRIMAAILKGKTSVWAELDEPSRGEE